MNKITMCKGMLAYDCFIVPTVRILTCGNITRITIEWLRWYIGFVITTQE